MKFLHKGECYYTEKILLVHFISMQLNFPVLSMFSCVAPQNAGFMDRRSRSSYFHFSWKQNISEKMVPQNIFTVGYFIATLFVDKQNKRKMDNFCIH